MKKGTKKVFKAVAIILAVCILGAGLTAVLKKAKDDVAEEPAWEEVKLTICENVPSSLSPAVIYSYEHEDDEILAVVPVNCGEDHEGPIFIGTAYMDPGISTIECLTLTDGVNVPDVVYVTSGYGALYVYSNDNVGHDLSKCYKVYRLKDVNSLDFKEVATYYTNSSFSDDFKWTENTLYKLEVTGIDYAQMENDQATVGYSIPAAEIAKNSYFATSEFVGESRLDDSLAAVTFYDESGCGINESLSEDIILYAASFPALP